MKNLTVKEQRNIKNIELAKISIFKVEAGYQVDIQEHTGDFYGYGDSFHKEVGVYKLQKKAKDEAQKIYDFLESIGVNSYIRLY